MPVEPQYTSNCSLALIEEVNCGFANQVYARFLLSRYGVDACILDQYDRFLVKKGLLDMNLIYDKDACTITCCPPCGIVVSATVFSPNSCQAPQDPVASGEVVTTPCQAPQDPEATLVY